MPQIRLFGRSSNRQATWRHRVKRTSRLRKLACFYCTRPIFETRPNTHRQCPLRCHNPSDVRLSVTVPALSSHCTHPIFDKRSQRASPVAMAVPCRVRSAIICHRATFPSPLLTHEFVQSYRHLNCDQRLHRRRSQSSGNNSLSSANGGDNGAVSGLAIFDTLITAPVHRFVRRRRPA